MEVINSWYRDAEQLLLRTRAVTWWRDFLTSRHTVSFCGDPSPDEIENAYRQANAKADADCDAIHIDIDGMVADASALGKRFESDWIDLFYLELRNIEIKQLPVGRCAFVPLQGLVWKVRNWGRELTDANKASRTLNCREVSDFGDSVRWVPSAVEAIRERLLLERLTIAKERGYKKPVDNGMTNNQPESDATESAANASSKTYDELPNSQRLAYLAFRYAAAKLECTHSLLTDSDAWKYLKQYGIEGADELDEYELPLKDTFADYMNLARRKLGEKKYSPRGGRTGGSVAKSSDL